MGIAAVNIDGQTIQKFFKFSADNKKNNSKDKSEVEELENKKEIAPLLPNSLRAGPVLGDSKLAAR